MSAADDLREQIIAGGYWTGYPVKGKGDLQAEIKLYENQWRDASIEAEKPEGHNNGGSTDYYQLPKGATELQDLIEHKDMNFAQGNMFKAIYRMGDCSHSDAVRDLNKIIWYAGREKARLEAR